MHNIGKSLIATALLIALTGCNSDNDNPAKQPTTCAEAGDLCTTFTLLHTNDNHGRFWKNKYEEYGMAARKTAIESIRAEVEADGGEVLLLSGGDINTGVPESDLQDAIPDFIGMNMIGYDAMAVGNHEFDNPLSIVEMQRSLANFPMLAANIYDKSTGKRYFDAYKIFTVNGLNIAVIGLTTEDTEKIANPEFISGLTFTDPKEEILKVIAEIKAASTAEFLDGERSSVRYQQTNLGLLIATAQATKVDADIGIINSGGVRASIEVGDISYRDVLTVQPFGNSITKSTMTGAQISEYLNTVATMQIGSGAYAQLTGLTMKVDCQTSQVTISDINGKGYNADTAYTFTVPSFNAAGGDGYPVLDPLMTGYVDAEVLYTYLKDKGSIDAGEFTPAGTVEYQNSLSSAGCQLAAE